MATQYFVPDVLVNWPCKRMVNPLLAEVDDEANAWVKSLALLEPAQLQKFYTYKFNLLAAHFGPLLNKDHLRVTCDLINLYFVIDEYTDIANKTEVGKIAKDIMDAFRQKKASESQGKITRMAREFIQRTVSVFGKDDLPGIERFISGFDAYLKSVIVEAGDRATGNLRTVNDYIIVRRDTCAAKPTFSCLGLGLHIPNEVFENPFIVSLLENAADLILISNDLHSYRIELSRRLEGHNIITVVMEEHHLDLQQALYWISGYASKTNFNLLAAKRDLPSWGEKVDQAVTEYIDRVVRCVRGNDSWHYDTKRYYGDHGSKVQEGRKMTLLPPASVEYITRKQLELEVAA